MMSESECAETIGKATDAAVVEAGSFEVDHAGTRVEGEVERSGPVGVRLKHLKVSPSAVAPIDLYERAADLEQRLRPGGERLRAVEVDARLGGGTLRSRTEDMRRGRYFQIDLSPTGDAEVRRYRVHPTTGERTTEAFDLTRRQLEELVEHLARLPSEDH